MPIIRTKRVLLALAALHMRRDEIDEFQKFVTLLPPGELHGMLRQIEQDMLLFGVGDKDSSRKEALFRSSTANETVNRVLTLLRNEARLGSPQIVDGLTE